MERDGVEAAVEDRAPGSRARWAGWSLRSDPYICGVLADGAQVNQVSATRRRAGLCLRVTPCAKASVDIDFEAPVRWRRAEGPARLRGELRRGVSRPAASRATPRRGDRPSSSR